MKKKLTIFILAMIMTVWNIQPVLSAETGTSAEEMETVRMGYCEIDGFTYGEVHDGLLQAFGYGIDYMIQLGTDYGCNIDFFRVQEQELLKGLDIGTYDIVISRIDEAYQLPDYTYSENVIAEEHCVIYVPKDADVYFKEYEKLNHMNFGLVEGSFYETELDAYGKEHNLIYDKTYFHSNKEALAALDEGIVDAVVFGSLAYVGSDYKNVDTFGTYHYGIAATWENQGILSDLDRKIEERKENNPVYVNDLYSNYYWNSAYSYPSLTRQEHESASSYGVIKVAYLNDFYPLECSDDNGDFSGIARRFFDFCNAYTGLEFEYYKYDNLENCYTDLNAGKIDLIAMVPYDKEWAGKNDILETQKYLQIPMYAITNQDLEEYSKIAMLSYFDFSDIFKTDDENMEILYYDTSRDCLDALKKGDAQVVVMNQFSWLSYSENESYSSFFRIKIDGADAVFSAAARSDEESREIVGILNKAINVMSEKYLSQIVVEEVLSSKDRGTILERFFNEFKYQVLVTLTILFALFMGIFIMNKKKKEELLKKLAYTDSVTGMANLTKFIKETEIKLKYNDVKYAIGYINIDNFKYINDFYGREQGDNVLRLMARMLEDLTIPTGVFARQSADRFVFLVEYVDYASLKYNIETYITDVDMSIAGFSDTVRIKCNCGVYLVEKDQTDIHDMIDRAALAEKTAREMLYESVVLYDNAINDVFVKNQEMTASMEKALANDEFVVYFQPKIDIQTEMPVSCEALVRWISPTKGFIPLSDFIPLFEKNGFITEVDFYVLDRVCRFLRRRMDEGKTVFRVSVNQSRKHIDNPMYLSLLQNTLNEYGIPMKLVMFEITESAFIENSKDMVELINRMKKLGFAFSMDDFGSGYSSFNLLKDMEIDELKIDKEFLDSTKSSERSTYIIEKIVQLAHGLNARVVCEGVETKEQLEFLRNIQCDEAQGYYYAKPMPMDEFEKYMESFEKGKDDTYET